MYNIPASITRPARYSGIEPNSIRKEPESIKVRFALCYPDVYEVGMSYYGLFLLYGLANSIDGVACERAFAPWYDMEEYLKSHGIPLATLETGTPLGETDVVGFSLTYELNITNVLTMLELAGIPLYAEERKGLPIIIAGGPLTLNPKPFERFFDLIVIGEGEASLPAILEVLKDMKGAPRMQIIEQLARIEGVYSPILGAKKVSRQYVGNLDESLHPLSPPIPVVNSVHNRLNIEVSRGCGNGCRFCLAGFGYRPYRERSFERVKEIIDQGLRGTGYGEISLLSLTAGDYSALFKTIEYVKHSHSGVSVSLPSLKIGTIGAEEIALIGKIARTGFTFALEAMTVQLRQRINKKIDVDALIRQIPALKKYGWRKLKLYLMSGFPWEEEHDWEELRVVLSLFAKTGVEINLSISPFIPKPHTPFQWLPMEEEELLREKLFRLKGFLKGKKINITYRDVQTSMAEAIISRGDERLTPLFLHLRSQGVRLEAWRECFRFDAYESWFNSQGMPLRAYTGERNPGMPLPWDLIDTGIDTSFLLSELERAGRAFETEDCYGGCASCGLHCETIQRETRAGGYTVHEGVRVRGHEEEEANNCGELPGIKHCFRYRKCGDARYIAHMTTADLLVRAIRAAGVIMKTHGKYHPMPKISLTDALPVGIESLCEFIEVEHENSTSIDSNIIQKINSMLPKGIKILQSWKGTIKSVVKDFAYMVLSDTMMDADDFVLLRTAKYPIYLYRGKKVKELLKLTNIRRIVKVEGERLKKWHQSL